MTKTLEEKVEQWFIDRNLVEANPVKQVGKLMEEAGELFEGVSKGKAELIFDALGDMQVVLIGLEMQLKNGNALEATAEELELLALISNIGDLAGKLFSHIYSKGTQIPIVKSELMLIHSHIYALAIHNDTSADGCLQISYHEIKDRKGKLVDGVFVKEADLMEGME